jgi:predicted transcriptional regulator of viral defense system
MKYIDFQRRIPTPIFTPHDLRLLDISYTPSQLTLWQQKGYLTKLRGGLYAFSHLLPTLPTPTLAARLLAPSYLSLEYALSHHGVIPEAAFTFTSVTTKLTHTYTLPQGHFTYQHLPPHLFFGYTAITTDALTYNLAEPEKALLDYYYLTPSLKNSHDLYELRLNTVPLDWDKLHRYLSLYGNHRVEYLVKITENMYAHA